MGSNHSFGATLLDPAIGENDVMVPDRGETTLFVHLDEVLHREFAGGLVGCAMHNDFIYPSHRVTFLYSNQDQTMHLRA